MAKPSLNLTAVSRPASNTSPILKRRNRFCANIDQQIAKIGLFREGKRISREQFWVDGSGAIYFQLRYGKQPLELEKGKSTLKALGTGSGAWDDLIDQLDQVKTLAVSGAMDESLGQAANAVRSNFKAGKDKKATRS